MYYYRLYAGDVQSMDFNIYIYTQPGTRRTKFKSLQVCQDMSGCIRLDKKLGPLTEPNWKKKTSSNAPTRVGMFRP